MNIHGSVVVVTGGANGIGAAMARRFAAEGAHGIVIADLDEAKAAAVATEVDRAGSKGAAGRGGCGTGQAPAAPGVRPGRAAGRGIEHRGLAEPAGSATALPTQPHRPPGLGLQRGRAPAGPGRPSGARRAVTRTPSRARGRAARRRTPRCPLPPSGASGYPVRALLHRPSARMQAPPVPPR
jgi:hypothetical protein